MKTTRIGVYGTLRAGHGNHSIIAHLPKVYEGNIGIEKLAGRGFPIIKLGDRYNLIVEVYDVPHDGTMARVDGLEGYTPGIPATFYDRKEVICTNNKTKEEEIISVYEYVSDFTDDIESECEITRSLYSWKKYN